MLPFSFHRTTHIDVQNNTHTYHVCEHIRPAVAYKRQWDSRNGHYSHRHADIFENMCRKHCADTRNKAGAEIIPRFYCNIHPAEKQCKENNNQYRTADESDRLRYAAEYEIRVPCRNIAKLCQRLLTEKALAREPSGTYCHLRLSDMVLCIVACGGRIQKNIDSVALLRGQNKKVHQHLQAQFKNRMIKKRYIALLDGKIPSKEGTITLPLRMNPLDRPRQIVDHEHGKTAITLYRVLNEQEGRTLIAFYPLTGRTHQLRVHAAHPEGLHCPIRGDELYGRKADRLYLHAESLEFVHPITKKIIFVEKKSNF